MKKSRCAINIFAAYQHQEKIDRLVDPLAEFDMYIDSFALAGAVVQIAPSSASSQG